MHAFEAVTKQKGFTTEKPFSRKKFFFLRIEKENNFAHVAHRLSRKRFEEFSLDDDKISEQEKAERLEERQMVIELEIRFRAFAFPFFELPSTHRPHSRSALLIRNSTTTRFIMPHQRQCSEHIWSIINQSILYFILQFKVSQIHHDAISHMHIENGQMASSATTTRRRQQTPMTPSNVNNVSAARGGTGSCAFLCSAMPFAIAAAAPFSWLLAFAARFACNLRRSHSFICAHLTIKFTSVHLWQAIWMEV